MMTLETQTLIDAIAILNTARAACASGPAFAWRIVSHAERWLDAQLAARFTDRSVSQ